MGQIYLIGEEVFPWNNNYIEKVSGPCQLDECDILDGKPFIALRPVEIKRGVFSRMPKAENDAHLYIASNPYNYRIIYTIDYEPEKKYIDIECVNVKSSKTGNVYRILNMEDMDTPDRMNEDIIDEDTQEISDMFNDLWRE